MNRKMIFLRALVVLSLAAGLVACGDDDGTPDVGTPDTGSDAQEDAAGDAADDVTADVEVDAGPVCPSHLRFEIIGAESLTTVGWTGLFHKQPLPDGYQFTVEVTECDATCTQCRFTGPVSNQDVDNRRCLNDTSVICGSDADCETAGVGGLCRLTFGPPMSTRALGGSPYCRVDYFTTDEVDGLAATAGLINLRTGRLDLERFSFIPTLNQNGPGMGRGFCATCEGDITPNDGVRDGVCTVSSGGDPSPSEGQPCDVNTQGQQIPGSFSYDCAGSAPLVPVLGVDVPVSSVGFDVSIDGSSPPATNPFAPEGLPVFCGSCTNDWRIPCASDSDCDGGTCGVIPEGCELNPPPLLPDGTPNPGHVPTLPLFVCKNPEIGVAASLPNACAPDSPCVVPDDDFLGTCMNRDGIPISCMPAGPGANVSYRPPQPENRGGVLIVRAGAFSCLPPYANSFGAGVLGLPGPGAMEYAFRIYSEFRDVE